MHIQKAMYLNLHQEFFDLETWLLENLNEKFRFIATIQTKRIICEGKNFDDDDGELFDGIAGIYLNLSIIFDDELDAMAYKLVWE